MLRFIEAWRNYVRAPINLNFPPVPVAKMLI